MPLSRPWFGADKFRRGILAVALSSQDAGPLLACAGVDETINVLNAAWVSNLCPTCFDNSTVFGRPLLLGASCAFRCFSSCCGPLLVHL